METPISPYQYITEMKKVLEIELEKVAKQKTITIQLQQFEMATLYNEIEKKLKEFVDKM